MCRKHFTIQLLHTHTNTLAYFGRVDSPGQVKNSKHNLKKKSKFFFFSHTNRRSKVTI